MVDAFDVVQIKAACEQAVKHYENAAWLFNITSATTIMSIGAYEVAQEHQDRVRWWYLDTGSTRVITASSKDVNEDIYNINLKQYLTANYCTTDEKHSVAAKTLQEHTWLPFALRLGTNTKLPPYLKDITGKIHQINRDRSKQDNNKQYVLTNLDTTSLSILEQAAELGIADDFSSNSVDECKFSLSKDKERPQFQFLDGTWLEVYVYHAIKPLLSPSDIEWGKFIVIRKGREQELDVAVMYKGKLFVIECKTGKEAFKQSTFQTLDSIANPIGGNFVTKLVITSLSKEDGYDREDWEMRAETSKIGFFFKDSLPIIGEKFVELASKSRGE